MPRSTATSRPVRHQTPPVKVNARQLALLRQLGYEDLDYNTRPRESTRGVA